MGGQRLTSEERTFFSRVVETIYTNPFSISRDDIEAHFGGSVACGTQRGEHHFSAVAAPLEARLSALERRGISRLQDLAREDRELVRHAYLFRSYHRCVDNLDEHIETQLGNPGEPAPVPFAREVLSQLEQKGLSTQVAARYFALFFQLRRAFYFIDRALLGSSQAMVDLRRALWRCVFTEDARIYDAYLWNRMEDFSTLLLGETGTGKGAAAAAIGRSGFIPFDPKKGRFTESFTETFTATNLSQFPESLLESELFGHRKGAFTGAVDNHAGLFERCSAHGSLFLDEIGEVSTAVQIKLLKVLQERTFIPVGSHTERRFSGRVIAATNRTLADLRTGGFRDDFYYRLSSQVITVPPLRQRIAESPRELEELTSLLLTRTTGSPEPALADHVLSVIRRDLPADYHWPGNVRELEQVIRRVLLSQTCPPMEVRPPARRLASDFEAGELTASELIHRYCHLLYSRLKTYEDVARRTGLDRRTVKKYVDACEASTSP